VIAAPVFSAAYQEGAGDILRCTKNGRIRLGIVKAAVALCISGVTFAVCSFVYILTVNSLFGWECTRTSIQMVYSIVTLVEMNVGQLQWFFALAGLLSVLATVSFTLLLSSRFRNTAASLAAAVVFCIMPVVVYMTIPGAVATWICSILPASGVSIQASILYAITDFKFLNLAGIPVWTPYAMVGADILEIPLFLSLAVYSYSRHTVN
ncbi:MAG: ABC transporter permease, partial [Acetatifactor sp.]|nr:ABC transporter permease [Acetatifactor sp.]